MTKFANKLKILIYRPKPAQQTIWANWLFKCEPLEVEYLYTVLKDYGEVVLMDGQVQHYNLVKEVRRHRPQILLLTAMITNINTVLPLAEKIKQLPRPPLIFIGGPHAEVLPQHFFTTYVDGVFFSNQLVAIQKVVEAIREGKDYRETPGAAFPIAGVFRANRAEAVDLNTLPIPDRPLLQKNKGKYNLFYYDDCASIKTSFGCPEHCTFCFCRKMNLEKYGVRPLEAIIQEIESIPNKNIFIVDDNFLLSPKRLKAFCEAIEARNIQKHFIAYSTSRFIARHPQLMKELRRAGLRAVLVGMEFIREDALEAVNKGSDLEENEACVDICHKLDIELIGLFMLSPEWPASEFRKLARYVRRRKIFLATFATLTTLPGTDLWTTANETNADPKKWWRFDLLRLHQKPRFMSGFRYYLWLVYLYLGLTFRPDGFGYFRKRAGVWTTLKMFFYGIISIFDFLIKVILWP